MAVTVLQRSCAPLAGGGEPAVQWDMEEDPENPAMQLSTTAQLCLHLMNDLMFYSQAPFTP